MPPFRIFTISQTPAKRQGKFSKKESGEGVAILENLNILIITKFDYGGHSNEKKQNPDKENDEG